MNVSYLVYLLIMLVLPILAEVNVTRTFKKYNMVRNSRGLTADQVARMILDSNGLYNTKIEFISGNLSDHYDPRANVVRLSNSTYGQISVAAIGVAAHECGHACQHAEGYLPIRMRSAVVPVTNICSRLWYLVFLIGLIFSNMTIGTNLILLSVIMFAAVVLFQIITLPTELNASRRAMATLERDGILESDELPKARKVLTAAAMTYVAGLVVSMIQFLRLLTLSRRR
ncbi:MAG: zinc metallopeptidase [Ruminococcus sp.]|nr:zinc metallopeptidase [Ruminococcus sp.]